MAAADVGANIFPIPPLDEVRPELSAALTRAQRRLTCSLTGLATRSLNWLSGVGKRPLTLRGSATTLGKLATIHDEMHHDMQAAAISWVVDDPKISSQEALSKILRGRSVYGVDQPAQAGMVKLNTGLLSVPASTAGSPSILDVSDSGESSFLLGFEQRMLRTAEEVRGINEQLGEPKHYVDPSLRSARRYSIFIRHLHRAGRVCFSLEASAHIGFFAVLKKDGRHRLWTVVQSTDSFALLLVLTFLLGRALLGLR